MKNKIYKGVIHSLLPQKGFGFITPVWANGDSEENVFFHLSETKGGKCFIPALASAENRQEVISKKGTKTYIPNEPQVVFFELEAQLLSNGDEKLIAKKIRDSKNVSDEEADQADANTTKPSVNELLHPETEAVNLTVTPETIQQVEEPEESDSAVVEEVQETEVIDNAASLECETYPEEEESDDEDDYEDEDDYYEEEYGDLQDAYDQSYAKSSRKYSPKDNSKDQ